MNRSRKIGKCIYCGRNDIKLSKEHIIPYGLGGGYTLLEASCSNCAHMTSNFEKHALREIYLSARSFYNLNSRHGKLPEEGEILIKENGKDKLIKYPIKRYGALISLLGYPLPAYIDKRKYQSGVTVTESYLLSTKTSEDLKNLAIYLGVKTLSIRATFIGNQFERTIVKMAYCFSLLHYGIESFDKIYVLQGIKGEKDDLGMWFGSKEPARGKEDIEVKITEIDKEIITEVRIFGKLLVPTYVIVVGKLK